MAALRAVGLIAAVVGLVFAAAGAAGPPFEGRVVAVIDGDTIDVLADGATTRIRLADIDTPERGQPWASRSKQALSARVHGKWVRVNEVAVDRWDRVVGEVYADDVCVGCELVREGHAWVFRRFTQDEVLLGLEALARKERRGLWSLPESERVPPWDWRRREGRSAAAPAEPAPRSFACGQRTRCSQMRSCAEARFHLDRCGLADLDGDADGVPCESLCNPARR